MATSTKIGIVSIGEMGLGVARLLIAHGYTVLTNINGRSQYTRDRAASASITLLENDEELALQADYILSIVPPRDALATAQRFTSATRADDAQPLYYLDLNAISPSLARDISALFETNAPGVVFVDGGIIGGAPRLIEQAASSGEAPAWKRPSIPISGPRRIPDEKLAEVLNTVYLGPQIGSASGLKCCFAALSKGLIALSVLSFSTAHSLGVYDELQRHLERFQPAIQASTSRMITDMPPKAGRWVQEMVEIGRCFGEEGGWDLANDGEGADVFQRVADVYSILAHETALGQERQEHRSRGTTAKDVAAVISEALKDNRGDPT